MRQIRTEIDLNSVPQQSKIVPLEQLILYAGYDFDSMLSKVTPLKLCQFLARTGWTVSILNEDDVEGGRYVATTVEYGGTSLHWNVTYPPGRASEWAHRRLELLTGLMHLFKIPIVAIVYSIASMPR